MGKRLHERNKTFAYGVVTTRGKILVTTICEKRWLAKAKYASGIRRGHYVADSEAKIEKLVISRLEINK